jgi:hypothetical protein
VYNEKDDQIFIRLKSDEEPIEFLIADQPLEMIRANVTTKEEIRETVEIGRQDTPNLYAKSFSMQGYSVAMTVFVKVDGFLRIIENVEKLYY